MNGGMTGTPPPRPDLPAATSRAEKAIPLALVLGVPLLAYTIPFLGPVAALATPIVAASTGPRVWPVRWWVGALAGVAALFLEWVALVVTSSALGASRPVEFLLVPLCAPEGLVWLLASAAAAIAYLMVAALSVRTRAIWIWPLAAAIGGSAFAATWAALEEAGAIRWIC